MKLGGLGLHMPVVSVSLPPDLVRDMDGAIARAGYKGRSQFIRAAARDHLLAQHAPSGKHVHGSITILYPHDKEARVSDARHAYHDVVLSLMHTHCEPETCMDVLIVGGPPERVHGLAQALERMRDVKRTRLVVMA